MKPPPIYQYSIEKDLNGINLRLSELPNISSILHRLLKIFMLPKTWRLQKQQDDLTCRACSATQSVSTSREEESTLLGFPLAPFFPLPSFWPEGAPVVFAASSPSLAGVGIRENTESREFATLSFPIRRPTWRQHQKKPSRLSNAKPLSNTIGRAMRLPKQHNPHKVMLHFRDSMASTFKKAQCEEYDSNSSLMLLCSRIELNSKIQNYKETSTPTKCTEIIMIIAPSNSQTLEWLSRPSYAIAKIT